MSFTTTEHHEVQNERLLMIQQQKSLTRREIKMRVDVKIREKEVHDLSYVTLILHSLCIRSLLVLTRLRCHFWIQVRGRRQHEETRQDLHRRRLSLSFPTEMKTREKFKSIQESNERKNEKLSKDMSYFFSLLFISMSVSLWFLTATH